MPGYQRDQRGNALIQFKAPDGRCRTLRLGKLSDRNAARFAEKLDQLLAVLTKREGAVTRAVS